MTQTARRAETQAETLAAEPVARRPLLSRLSLGHVIMVVAGLLAFLLVLALLRDQTETIFIAVAGGEIEAGTALDTSDVKMVEAPSGDTTLFAGFLTQSEVDAAIAEGRIANRTIQADDPILESDLRSAELSGGLRAMAVPLTPGRSVAGAVEVGDRIDIVVVRQGVSSYVATNVEVIAVSRASGGSIAASGDLIVTIATDAPTTLVLSAALADGEIFVIRATGAAPADPLQFYDPRAGDA